MAKEGWDNRRSHRIGMGINNYMEEIAGPGNGRKTKTFSVEIIDISKDGIGIKSDFKLKEDSFYIIYLDFPSREKLQAFVKIVRCYEDDKGDMIFGGVFVGMNEAQQFKIEVYRMFCEEERKKAVEASMESLKMV